jgi:hypothetical protein
MRRGTILLQGVGLAGWALWAASRSTEIDFERRMIDSGAYETCAIGDGDGEMDLAMGGKTGLYLFTISSHRTEAGLG